jgi:hypothetical protein
MPEGLQELDRERRMRQAEEAFLLENFGERRKAYDAWAKTRRSGDRLDRSEDLEARIRAGEPLRRLSGQRDYEVGPAKAQKDRAGGGELDEQEAALIKKRYPTLSKWMGLGRRGTIAEKLPGGKKLHKKLEMLPARLKNAAKGVIRQVKDELDPQTNSFPFGFNTGMAKLAFARLAESAHPDTPEHLKPWLRDSGWKDLVGELKGAVKSLPHEAKMLKHEAALGYGGYGTNIYADELDIFGIEGRLGGLVDEAGYDYRKKSSLDQQSPYHDPSELHQLKKRQARQYNRELWKRKGFRPDPTPEFDPEA